MDGFEVVLYKIEEDHLKKMWNVEEYGQIPVLNELRDEFYLTLPKIRAKKLQTLTALDYSECVQLIDECLTVDNALYKYRKRYGNRTMIK